MTVALDPETGALGAPSGEQVRALGLEERAVSRTAEGLIEIYRTDGAVGMDLRGRFQDYIVARIGKNGRPIFGCLHGDRGVAPAAGDSVPAPAALEEW